VISGGWLVISTAQDLTLTWDGGEAGNVMRVSIPNNAPQYFPGSQDITCSWDASLGRGTISQTVLAPLKGQLNNVVWYAQSAQKTVTVGPYSLTMSANQSAMVNVSFE
jgi:hypothetical protein